MFLFVLPAICILFQVVPFNASPIDLASNFIPSFFAANVALALLYYPNGIWRESCFQAVTADLQIRSLLNIIANRFVGREGFSFTVTPKQKTARIKSMSYTEIWPLAILSLSVFAMSFQIWLWINDGFSSYMNATLFFWCLYNAAHLVRYSLVLLLEPWRVDVVSDDRS